MTSARFIDGPTQITLFNRHFAGFLDVLRQAIIDHADTPPRVVHEFPLRASPYGETHLRFLYMPAMYDGTPGLKLLAQPLPVGRRPSTVRGLTILFDADSAILAVLDARTLTSLRTACVTALGAKYLARKVVQRIGLVGLGLQGRTHLAVLSRLYPEATSRVYHRRAAAIEEYRRAHPEQRGVIVAQDAFEAAHEADILVTTTTSTTPFVQADWVHAGMLYCQIGRDEECTVEAVLRFDRLVADDWDQTRREGHKVLAKAHLARQLGTVTNLGDVLSGRTPGRLTDAESIMLSCTGLSVEDVATARFIADHAVNEGLGIRLDLSDAEL
jgi:N-[(2S)-2-amino-2-carboxyethyl]-L-glutamate dehydrogenase